MKYFFDKLQCINKKEKNNMKYVVLNFNALIRRIRREEKKRILTHLMKYVTNFWCSVGVLNANALT